jgi:hypothetical protein
MKIDDYYELDELEQCEELWDRGTFLAHRDEKDFRYMLYSLHGFFVELRYNKEHNLLTGLRAYTSEEDEYLSLFITNRDITDLIKSTEK